MELVWSDSDDGAYMPYIPVRVRTGLEFKEGIRADRIAYAFSLCAGNIARFLPSHSRIHTRRLSLREMGLESGLWD